MYVGHKNTNLQNDPPTFCKFVSGHTLSPVTAGSGVPASLLEVSWKVSRFMLA